jgi:hypothetical protein
MREEFPDCYNTLFESGIRRLRKQWILKLQAMQKCSEQHQEYKKLKIQNRASDESFSLGSSDSEDNADSYKLKIDEEEAIYFPSLSSMCTDVVSRNLNIENAIDTYEQSDHL